MTASFPSDLDAIKTAVAIYDPTSKWDQIFQINGVYAGLRRFTDHDELTFRGSDNLEDWLRDLDVFSFRGLATVPTLGRLHFGMWDGMEGVYEQVAPLLRPRARLRGHSLGASHGGMMAGQLTAAGSPPSEVVLIGEPKHGMTELVQLLAPVPYRSYCNVHEGTTDPLSGKAVQDPVTKVAMTIAPLFPFARNRELILMPAEPTSPLPTALHLSAFYEETAVRFFAG